jgi:hypothetical protein
VRRYVCRRGRRRGKHGSQIRLRLSLNVFFLAHKQWLEPRPCHIACRQRATKLAGAICMY